MEHKVNMPRPIDSECISKKCHPVNKTSVFGMMDHQPPMSPLGPSPPSSPVGLEMKCHITYKMVKRNLGLHIAWEHQVVACPEHNWLTSPSWAALWQHLCRSVAPGRKAIKLADSLLCSGQETIKLASRCHWPGIFLKSDNIQLILSFSAHWANPAINWGWHFNSSFVF